MRDATTAPSLPGIQSYSVRVEVLDIHTGQLRVRYVRVWAESRAEAETIAEQVAGPDALVLRDSPHPFH